MDTGFKHRFLFITLITLTICFTAASRPARHGQTVITQPDGTTFISILKGDEFIKTHTTTEGYPIIKDKDGWWCYAYYEEDGSIVSTGYMVGQDTPASILANCRNIPYTVIAENAALKRRLHEEICEDTPILARMLSSRKTAPASAPIEKHGIIILAEFKDVQFTYNQNDFNNLINKIGYNVAGATGCAKEYFDAQFNGKFNFIFDVSPVVTLPDNRAHYGANNRYGQDSNPAEMIEKACRLAQEKGVDFSRYDDDGDGYVDNVFVFFAGEDEAEGADSDCIWSHQWYLSGARIFLSLNGKIIDSYACTSELSRRYDSYFGYRLYMNGIGSFCHEYTHTFGVPDLYDTDDLENGYSGGVWGTTSLMDYGSYNNDGNTPPFLNAIEREFLFTDVNGSNVGPETITEDGLYTMQPVSKGGTYYKIETETENEFFLLECRDNNGWDKYIGGSGMLVYHVDKTSSMLSRWTLLNTVNTNSKHQCAQVLEADNRQDSFNDRNQYYTLANNIKGIFYPYGNTNSITSETSPSLASWNGTHNKAMITGIRKEGNNIQFSVAGNSEESTPPTAVNSQVEEFADAAIIRFESSRVYEQDAIIEWGRHGSNEISVMKVSPYEPGKYSITLEGLEPGGKTYLVNISFEINGVSGKALELSVMTKKLPPVEWPYIYMGSVKKDANGYIPVGTKLPLRVYNTLDAAKIEWTFDGKPVRPEGDGYFTVTKSGTLMAKVYWITGGHDTILKEIITTDK